jgi:hypothetical protein
VNEVVLNLELDVDIEDTERSKTTEGKTRAGMRSKMTTAYQEYLEKRPGSLDRLVEIVRKFAYMKVYHLEYEFRNMGSAETADDWALDPPQGPAKTPQRYHLFPFLSAQDIAHADRG